MHSKLSLHSIIKENRDEWKKLTLPQKLDALDAIRNAFEQSAISSYCKRGIRRASGETENKKSKIMHANATSDVMAELATKLNSINERKKKNK